MRFICLLGMGILLLDVLDGDYLLFERDFGVYV